MNRLRRRQRLRALRVGAKIALASVVGLHAVGILLPTTYRQSIHLMIPASPATVWALLMDLDAMPDWRSDVEALERLPESRGRTRWVEVRGRRRMAVERAEARVEERLVLQPVLDAERWRRVYDIAATPHGARIMLTDEREIGVILVRPLVRLLRTGRGRVELHARELSARAVIRRHQLVVSGSGRGPASYSTPQRARAAAR